MRGHGFNLFQMYKVWVRNSNEIIKLNLNNSNRPRSKIIDLRRSEVCFWVTVFPSIGPRRSRVGSSISNACLNPGGPVTCYGLHVAFVMPWCHFDAEIINQAIDTLNKSHLTTAAVLFFFTNYSLQPTIQWETRERDSL